MVNSGVGSECQENRQKQVTSELLLSEIQNQTDLLSLSGRTLCVTAGASPSPISSPSTLLCQYLNLQLLNAEPQGERILCTLLLERWASGSSQAQLPDLASKSSSQLQHTDTSQACCRKLTCNPSTRDGGQPGL